MVPYVTSSSGDLTAYAALAADDTINIPARSIVTIVAMNTPTSDFDIDGDVDIDDLNVMAGQWLDFAPAPTADISIPADNIVNFKDFAQLAKNWLYGVTP